MRTMNVTIIIRTALVLAIVALLVTCGQAPSKKINHTSINKPIEVISEKGEQGEKGATGIQGVKGEDGNDGTSMTVVEKIICTDNIPNFAGVRFVMEIIIFSTDDNYMSVSMFDDDRTFANNSGFGIAGDYVIDLYHDKQQNDDWGVFRFFLDYDTLMYQVQYLDTVDGDESYLVPNKCISEVL